MLQRAEKLCSRLPADEGLKESISILERIGLVYRVMGRLEQADKVFERMQSQARLARDVRSELKARLWRASVLSWVDRDRCLENVDRATELCSQVDDPFAATVVEGQIAYWNLLFRGWDERDKDASARAVEVVRASGDLPLLSLHAGRYAYFLCLSGQYQEACSVAEDSIRAAVEVNDLTDYSLSHFFEAWALLHGGDWDRLRHVLNGAISMATRNGHELWCVLFRLLEAWFHNYTHAFAEAARSCTECADRAAAWVTP